MTDIAPVAQSGAPATTNPANETDAATLQNAFAQGIVQFMGVMLQSAESDVISSINDSTSDPDSPENS